jgi:2-methylcitrate dehydratase PrpD
VIQVSAEENTTATLARFVASTSITDVPDEVVEAVKWVVMDTIGVTVAGVNSEIGNALIALAREFGGAARSTVIGTDLRCDPAWAALVNGSIGHALDYDDQSWTMGGHPSVVLLPALLALGEDRAASGPDVILAYAIGFEVASFIGRTVNPGHYGHGWHTTGTIGAVAAAAASASLLGLNEDQCIRALAISASTSAGLRQNFGTSIKPYHAGNAARAGVMAAKLAGLGLGGDPQILEGRWGFFNVFGTAERGIDVLELGQPWHLVKPGVATKVFPSCGATHPGIGAMLELREKGLRADEVESIQVRVVDMTERILEHHRPQTPLEAKFSLEYCLARALVNGSVELDHFLPDAVKEPEILRIIEQIEMIVDPVLTEQWVWGTPRATEITVRLTNGDVIENRADLPPGSPGNFSREMLEAKFHDCLGRGSIRGTPAQIFEVVGGLTEVEDIGKELMVLLQRS